MSTEYPPLDVPALEVPDYELLRRIGRGSYGGVWLARNVMGEYRAVKVVCREAFDSDRPFEREFAGIREFEPLSRARESQVDILHVGRHDGLFYYVMELADDLKGGREIDPEHYVPRTLRSELQECGRLPVEECVEIMLSLTSALGHLHRNGLVHRDVKPSNVIFVNGTAKLADIGLVASTDATFSLVGTEGFLPPEGPGQPQADIYGLGKVLYEMSTGLDRQDFPELPIDLPRDPERKGLVELNEVILKACARGPSPALSIDRRDAPDLALLQSGRSVKRHRQLKRRLNWTAKAAALGTVACLAVFGLMSLFEKAPPAGAQVRAAQAPQEKDRKMWSYTGFGDRFPV